ncbi:MAG: hypothetical protein KDD53_07715, partial [Bdellovibrionales bacterium]|nr:hypothetical protein [Bdellovibrionales bacterium]
MSSSKRLRVAWFSALNKPSELTGSLSSYLTDEIVEFVAQDFDVEIFSSGFEPYRDFPTSHYLAAFQRHRANPFDIFFYQVEDRASSDFCRAHLGLMPGVVLFHDLLFKSEGPEPLHNSPWRVMLEMFKNNQGDWPSRDFFWPRREPFAHRESALSLVPIFSSTRNLSEFRRETKGALYEKEDSESPWEFYLPYPGGTPVELINRSNQDPIEIGFCGSADIEHRAHKVLQALSRLKFPYRLNWLVEAHHLDRAKKLCSE